MSLRSVLWVLLRAWLQGVNTIEAKTPHGSYRFDIEEIHTYPRKVVLTVGEQGRDR